MQMCSRCHKRMAVLFITKIENNETKNEGLCLKCAKELGIPQVDTILSNMGISDDDLENMENDLEGLLASGGTEGEDSEDEHKPHAGARLFQDFRQSPDRSYAGYGEKPR